MVGGAGFLGSHLVDRLLAERHAVEVVDDLSSGTLANLAAARSAGGELKIHHLDVCTVDFLTLVAMRRPDVIIDLAWAPPGRREAGDPSRQCCRVDVGAARPPSGSQKLPWMPA